jgi:glycosyltransferase involved in cell wall biosynthesis
VFEQWVDERSSTHADSPQIVDAMSVIIAARNEEYSLPRCLRAIFKQAPMPVGLEVIVVANNCSDRTADVARSLTAEASAAAIDLVVLEESRQGKHLALNAGDRAATNPSRAYVDADVLLSPGTLLAAQRALRDFPLVAPSLQVIRPASALGRSYAAVWLCSPAVSGRVIGCGFYAVSESGRIRWDEFPDIISDDTFVRLHFARHEQKVLDDQWAMLSLPAKTGELLRIRGRWCRGNRQVLQRFPQLVDHDRAPLRRATATRLIRTPALWRHAPGAVLVYTSGLLLARLHAKRGPERWETGVSSDIRRRA